MNLMSAAAHFTGEQVHWLHILVSEGPNRSTVRDTPALRCIIAVWSGLGKKCTWLGLEKHCGLD